MSTSGELLVEMSIFSKITSGDIKAVESDSDITASGFDFSGLTDLEWQRVTKARALSRDAFTLSSRTLTFARLTSNPHRILLYPCLFERYNKI